mmetsp:Transcript_8518/g.18378  ORF Transcript_8518/g.18378 Transcript_8518/m.18378 type:complete len:205 (-) Transcript_8518:974-1588(-)
MAHPEVGQFGNAPGIQQDILRFEVTMNDVMLMQIGQSMHNIDKVQGGMIFIKMSIHQSINRLSIPGRFLSPKRSIVLLIRQDFPQRHVFNHHVQDIRIRRVNGIVKLHQIGMLQLFHERNFSFHRVERRLVLNPAGLLIPFHGPHAFENGLVKNLDRHQMFLLLTVRVVVVMMMMMVSVHVTFLPHVVALGRYTPIHQKLASGS